MSACVNFKYDLSCSKLVISKTLDFNWFSWREQGKKTDNKTLTRVFGLFLHNINFKCSKLSHALAHYYSSFLLGEFGASVCFAAVVNASVFLILHFLL